MVYILHAVRTPIGRFMKTFADTSAVCLGTVCMRAVLQQSGTAPDRVQDVIVGQVLTAGVGMNPARQSAISAGIPVSTPALTINQVCGSGLRSVILGVQGIESGLDCVLSGGQENMSLSQFCAYYDRKNPQKNTDALKDTMLTDGLLCAIGQTHMGITAENLAKKYDIGREEQDVFALQSQQKAQTATEQGYFNDEIVTVNGIATDQHIRHNLTLTDLQDLPPVFDKENGTVTAGNASGINDGASMVLLGSEEYVNRHSLSPLARIVSYGVSGVAPELMGIGPVGAVQMALQRAGWHLNEIDVIEANEAFAVQAIAVNRLLGWDTDKVNVNGGAVALGHPIGASGSRILTTLTHTLHRLGQKRGVATLCVGGGMGVAMCIENCSNG